MEGFITEAEQSCGDLIGERNDCEMNAHESDLTRSNPEISSIELLLQGIDSVEDWNAKEARIRSIWLERLGTPPIEGMYDEIGTDGIYEVISEMEEDDHSRLYVRYGTRDGDTVFAYLLLPHKLDLVDGKSPAVLALHPTSETGKADISLKGGRENRRYGLELVSRGYVVLAPDSIAFGDRVYKGEKPFQTAPFYDRYPAWTAVGKMMADHIRGVDILTSLPQVQSERIGVIGHSLGGYNGWFLAGMDQRIKAVVSSCGFSMFSGDPELNRWGNREWFSHIPSLTQDRSGGNLPFEWHEIAALAAPTPIFMWCGTRDVIFPNWRENTAGLTDLEYLYRFLNKGESYECWIGAEGHDFPLDIRERAYRFLDRHLGK